MSTWPGTRRLRLIPVIVILGVVAGAVGGSWARQDPEKRPADELLAVERAFCAMAAESGIHAAFTHYIAADGVVFDVDPRRLRGPAALEARRERWSRITRLDWTPLHAEVAESGDLGFTWGTSRMEIRGEDGALQTVQALYVSVWRRDPEGRWKFALDTGNPLPE